MNIIAINLVQYIAAAGAFLSLCFGLWAVVRGKHDKVKTKIKITGVGEVESRNFGIILIVLSSLSAFIAYQSYDKESERIVAVGKIKLSDHMLNLVQQFTLIGENCA